MVSNDVLFFYRDEKEKDSDGLVWVAVMPTSGRDYNRLDSWSICFCVDCVREREEENSSYLDDMLAFLDHKVDGGSSDVDNCDEIEEEEVKFIPLKLLAGGEDGNLIFPSN